jgi:asparagine synthase (glutamine-hydrolysing)
MLMGHSIEGRFPFLDYRVAEFAAALPDELRLHGLNEKHLLRRAVAPYIPPEIAARKKRPYRAPIARVFVGPGAPEYVAALLEPSRLEEAGIFDPDAISRLVLKCEGAVERPIGETDEMALVGAVSTMLLHDLLVAEPRLAAPSEPTRIVVGDRVEAGVRAGEPEPVA